MTLFAHSPQRIEAKTMPDHEYRYPAAVDRVVDGDTYDVSLDLGFGVFKEVRVRLRNVDTDEIYGVPEESDEFERGTEQMEFVEKVLETGEEIIVQTYKGDEKGKYGRWLADVEVDGITIAEQLKSKFPALRSE